MISEQPQGAVLRLGKVVKVHPSDHSINLVMLDNGAKLANVQLLSPTASTRSGRVDLPAPDLPDEANEWSLEMSHTQDLLAVVAMMDGMALCLGFLYPQVNQLAMTEDTKNLRIDRHASDLYTVTDDAANTATHHPYGAYTSMGATSGAPAIGSNHAFDQNWAIARNTKNVAVITQYTPLKKASAHSDQPDEVIGHGRTTVAPTQVDAEVRDAQGDSQKRGHVTITSSSVVAGVADGKGGSASVTITAGSIVGGASKDIRLTANDLIAATAAIITLN